MALKFISMDSTPTYLAVSTDIVDDKIEGAGFVGKTVYTTDDGAWYIIENDLTLSAFSFGGDTDVSAIKTDTEAIIADVADVQTVADETLEDAKEIERHIHSAASWFGAAITPDGEDHVADRIGAEVSAFQLDGGDNDWGAWVQILGADDTPARAGQAFFDPHEIVITASQDNVPFFIQFARGASGEAGYAAGTYTELVLDLTSRAGGVIVSVQTGRAPAGSKLWARCLAVGQNTDTVDFYLGIHEYEE